MAGRGARKSVWLRLVRWIVALLAAFLLLSAGAVLALRFVNPATTAFIIEARVAAWNEPQPFDLRYRWRDLRQISPNAALAVVASEDQLFPYHSGFDLKSIRKAIQSNDAGGRVRGASTISQQVAKNLFLWPSRGWLRKGLEAWFTLLLEWIWPKQRILEVYLNVAEFGRGIYGVEAASQTYFRKPSAQLSAHEAALLAAVLPSPRRYSVTNPGPYVAGRRNEIVKQMHALGGRNWLRGILPN
ncbi:MAG: monofunctional biosynthetic peptidoglycan transglycosylase [Steroidobacteraceae bacterium]